jgi:transcriptional regulator with XRE-family HTH domain
MAKISMTPGGRFGQLLGQAVQKKGISLKALADQIEVSYEQARKLYIGASSPSPHLLKEIVRRLGMDLKAAQEAATADKMERRYGAAGLKVRGQDPRLTGLVSVAALLNDSDIAALVAMAQSLVAARQRA